jgi:cobalt-zinc-cadmium efflux system membrane fusion protein
MRLLRWTLAGVLVLLLGAAGVYVLSRRGTPPEPVAAPAEVEPSGTGSVKFLMEQQWLIRMKLAKAERVTVARQLRATGRIVPAAGRYSIVAPPVGGQIVDASLPPIGRQVGRGQVLAELRQTPTAAEALQIEAGRAQLRLERARLDADRARLAEAVTEAEVRLNQARLDLERARRLYERKAYSLRHVQVAEAEYQSARSLHASALAQRDALAAPPADASDSPRPATYRVTAPIGGTVVKVHKQPGAQVAPGDPILEIVNFDTVWVEAPIFEGDLGRLAPGASAVFTTPAVPGSEFRGRLVHMGRVVDEASRTVTAVFEVPNPRRILRIGLQASIRLDAGERVDAVLIPKDAVLEHEGKRIVYVLLSGEEFQRREIMLGDEYGDTVAVVSGLKPGERVVTQGAYQIRLQELRPTAPGAHTHET